MIPRIRFLSFAAMHRDTAHTRIPQRPQQLSLRISKLLHTRRVAQQRIAALL